MKKGKDINPGDVTLRHGLILEIDRTGTDMFWEEKASVTFISIHDAYYGKCSSGFDDEFEYEVMTGEERSDFLKHAELQIRENIGHLQEDILSIKQYMVENEDV